MSFILSLLGGVWGRVTAVVVALVSVVTALAGVRYRIRKTARDEMAGKMRERTIERIAQAKEVEDEMGRRSDNDIREWLSEHGYFRD